MVDSNLGQSSLSTHGNGHFSGNDNDNTHNSNVGIDENVNINVIGNETEQSGNGGDQDEENEDDDDDGDHLHHHHHLHQHHHHHDHDMVVEDHQALNNQVNQYFQHIKQYASENAGNDDDDDDDNDDEDEDEDNDVHGNPVTDVDFGDVEVDLDLNIDTAISEGLVNYDPNNDINMVTNKQTNLNASKNLNDIENSRNHNTTITDNNNNNGNIIKSNSNTDINKNINEINLNDMVGRVVVTNSIHNNLESNVTKRESSSSATDISKRHCQFCGKTFQHAGSLGRHLDNQKGNELHPLEEVEKIRSNVARRGDPEAIKARRLQRSKEYNRRDYVKEKNRLRRKFTSRLSRVKESYQMKFYRRINHPTLPTHPSFPRMVLFFLPPNSWPHDPPTTQTFKTLVMWLETNKDVQSKIPHLTKSSTVQSHLEKLTIGFENWQTLSTEEKKDMWIREQRAVSQQLLGDLSIFDFAIRDNWAKHLMMEKKLEINKESEIYHDVIMSDSNTSRTDVNSDHVFHENNSSHHYSHESDDSNDSENHGGHHHHNENHNDNHHHDIDHLDHMGDLNSIDNIVSLGNQDQPLSDEEFHDEHDVKIEEADLAAVAAAAAVAAVKENGF